LEGCIFDKLPLRFSPLLLTITIANRKTRDASIESRKKPGSLAFDIERCARRMETFYKHFWQLKVQTFSMAFRKNVFLLSNSRSFFMKSSAVARIIACCRNDTILRTFHTAIGFGHSATDAQTEEEAAMSLRTDALNKFSNFLDLF
jgi:hypothetical protein